MSLPPARGVVTPLVPSPPDAPPGPIDESYLGGPDAAPALVPPPPPPPAAVAVFGDRIELARAYAALLCGAGAVRGVIGPRETERIWDRHVLNCAVLAPLLPECAAVTDVGSGGGLPGIVLALARPDLRLTLVDSMQRRTEFLTEVVAELQLGERVEVVRGRAEELRRRDQVVTARAVADPVRLARWAVRLLGPAGRLAVLIGARAAEDRATWVPLLQKSGWGSVSVQEASIDGVSPSWVLEARRR